ncbi:MAG: hypothetical protein NWS64_04365 [Microbacteriaceae bacterium]|nr:hypothetical protein [Microbacteriaceae bacterium]
MRSVSSRDDRGLVTLEIAIAIPALLLVVGLIIGVIRWSMDAVTATSVAAELARDIVRGEPLGDRLVAAKRIVPLAEWSTRVESFEACVDARFPPPLPLMGHVTVSQCAPR